jgi:tungstate transport system ATP-binding protein
MTSILDITYLLVRRGERTVLEIEQLEIADGETLALIGPNGAGKSTLLLALGALIRPENGQVLFRGRDIADWGELNYRRRIGLVMQEPLLLDRSVSENVAYGLKLRRRPQAEIRPRVGEWLERMGVAHLRDRSARRLSGGEAQRVALARAFALQPEILLLDEPFSALDAPTRLRLLEDLHTQLQATGVTAIFVTHDLDEALAIGKRVGVMLDGRLRQIGPPLEVFNAPSDPEVANFVGMETILEGKVISAEAGVVSVAVGQVRLEAAGEGTAGLKVGRMVLFCLRPEDITVWPDGSSTQAIPASSARNRLEGVVSRVMPQGQLARVTLDCGFPLTAVVTRASLESLDLAPGRRVTAAFKASAVHLIPR